jgi:hypothetical protein
MAPVGGLLIDGQQEAMFYQFYIQIIILDALMATVS